MTTRPTLLRDLMFALVDLQELLEEHGDCLNNAAQDPGVHEALETAAEIAQQLRKTSRPAVDDKPKEKP